MLVVLTEFLANIKGKQLAVARKHYSFYIRIDVKDRFKDLCKRHDKKMSNVLEDLMLTLLELDEKERDDK